MAYEAASCCPTGRAVAPGEDRHEIESALHLAGDVVAQAGGSTTEQAGGLI